LCDFDGDYFVSKICGGTDCDDNDSAKKPGAAELCNGIDDNCNGAVDENISMACECASCENCTLKLNLTCCSSVKLTRDIYSDSTCINDPGNFINKTFDGQGYKITGGGIQGNYGIHLNSKNNNTIKNLLLINWHDGIYINNSQGSTIMNNTAILNILHGILLEPSLNNSEINNTLMFNNINKMLEEGTVLSYGEGIINITIPYQLSGNYSVRNIINSINYTPDGGCSYTMDALSTAYLNCTQYNFRGINISTCTADYSKFIRQLFLQPGVLSAGINISTIYGNFNYTRNLTYEGTSPISTFRVLLNITGNEHNVDLTNIKKFGIYINITLNGTQAGQGCQLFVISVYNQTPQGCCEHRGLHFVKIFRINTSEIIEGNLSGAFIKIYYNETELKEKYDNFDPARLAIYWFNASTQPGVWEVCDSHVNQGGGFVWVRVDHFSDYALMYDTYSSKKTTGGGGGHYKPHAYFNITGISEIIDPGEIIDSEIKGIVNKLVSTFKGYAPGSEAGSGGSGKLYDMSARVKLKGEQFFLEVLSGGIPLSGAKVQYGDYTGYTDNLGKAGFEAVQDINTVVITKDGNSLILPVEIEEGQKQAGYGDKIMNVNIHTIKNNLVIQLTDRVGDPVSSADIVIDTPYGVFNERTDSGGRCEFEVSESLIKIKINKEGYYDIEKTIKLEQETTENAGGYIWIIFGLIIVCAGLTLIYFYAKRKGSEKYFED